MFCKRELPFLRGYSKILTRPDICDDCSYLMFEIIGVENNYEMIKLLKDKASSLNVPKLIELYDKELEI